MKKLICAVTFLAVSNQDGSAATAPTLESQQLLCETVEFPLEMLGEPTPLAVVTASRTIQFNTAAGAMAVGPNEFTPRFGFTLSESAGSPGSELSIEFDVPIREVLNLPFGVNDPVGPATVTFEMFSGNTSLGAVQGVATVPNGADFAEGSVRLTPSQSFDRITVVSGDATREFAIGRFTVCDKVIVDGDLDYDGDVDLNDFDMLSSCAGGSGIQMPFPCSRSDFDGDGDVDCDDVTVFDGIIPGGLGKLPDGDADNIADACDNCPEHFNPGQADCTMDGIGDVCWLADGGAQDCNGNGLPDGCETDCNFNGLHDDCDISAGTSFDCDGNGVPDECQQDCDADGLPDVCDPDKCP